MEAIDSSLYKIPNSNFNNDNNNNLIPSIDQENEGELDALIIQIYESNSETINNLSTLLQIAEILSITSILVFLILLAIKLSPLEKISWVFINILCIITIITIMFILNVFLRIKTIIDISERRIQNNINQDANSIHSGILFSYIILNSICILVIIFSILLTLRLEGIIKFKTDLNIIFIPLYCAFILGVVYSAFISPAFIFKSLYVEICIAFFYFFSGFIFCILLCMKKNNINSNLQYFHIFIPLYFILGAHLFYIIFKIISKQKKEPILNKLLIALLLVCFIISSIIIQSKNDNYIKSREHFIEVIIVIIGVSLYAIDYIINSFCTSNEE